MFPCATMRQSLRLMHRPPLFLLHYVELSVRLVNKPPPPRYILQKQSPGTLKLFDFTPSWLYYLSHYPQINSLFREPGPLLHFSSSLKKKWMFWSRIKLEPDA